MPVRVTAQYGDAMTSAIRSPILAGFAIAAVVHLSLNAADIGPWDSITKCLLAPLLIGWVLEQRGPRLLVAALAFCFAGDLLLELEDMFIVGMAAFAAAHVCFIGFFVQRGAGAALRARPAIVGVYVVAAVVVVAWAWGGLDAGLRPVIPVYAALLVGTASTALAVDVRAGVGGALFLVSDGIIALAEAGRFDPAATLTGLAIMVLYIGAIAQLTIAIVTKEQRTVAAGTGFDPTVRTDCWPRLPDTTR